MSAPDELAEVPDADARLAAVGDVLGSHDPRYGFEVCSCGAPTPLGYREWQDHVAAEVLRRLDGRDAP